MKYEPTTILHLVDEGFRRLPDRVCSATKRGGTWIPTTVAAFKTRTRQVALGLYALGIRRGDRVGLHAENSTEWLIVDQALLSVGAVNVPIYTTQPGEQIKYILENAGARAFFVSTPALFEATRPYIDSIPCVETTVGFFGAYHPGMKTLDEVAGLGMRLHEENPVRFDTLRSDVGPDDLASLIYTSGTTGLPKGVMLTHNNLASNVQASLERLSFSVDKHRGESMVSYLPLSHVFERMIVYLYLFAGFPVYFSEAFTEVLEDLQTVRPVHFTTVPRLLEKVHIGIISRLDSLSGVQKQLLEWAVPLAEAYDVEMRPSLAERLEYAAADVLVYRRLRDLFGGKLLSITSGGAALSGSIMNFFNAIGIFCGQGYGLTESSPVIAVYQKGALRAGAVGKVLTDVDVRLASDGEILARGPNIMKGYFDNPKATQEVLTEDGWLHTGDIGVIDADGYLFITDRKKALFKLSTGKYVAPQPLETALIGHMFIEQVIVVGSGQKFCAALIFPNYESLRRHIGTDASLAEHDEASYPPYLALLREVIDEVNQQFPHWEQIKKIRLLKEPLTVEQGELTPTLKTKRRVVSEKYSALIASMYA